MQIDINKTQAAIIQELLLANSLQTGAINEARELFNQCQAVRDEPDPDDEQRERSRATSDAPIKPLREESHAAGQPE